MLLIITALAGCESPVKDSTPITHTISFNTNGGSAVPDQQVIDGNHAVEPIPPTQSNHVFVDWYSDSGLTRMWDFDSATVNSAMTLYAKWEVLPDISIENIYIPGGSFQMGSDMYSDGDELPVHKVSVSPFYIGKYEVTQEQWKAVMGSGNNPSYFEGDSLPVENVSWYETVEFCNALSIKEGLEQVYTIGEDDGIAVVTADFSKTGWRLPTEAEWAYAARGGNQSEDYRFSGSNTPGDVGWYKSNSDYKTHPVGEKAANELGLFDMSGNVLEWCWDWYGSYGSEASPTGPDSGVLRVTRGGGWNYSSSYMRSAARNYFLPSTRSIVLGFRLVRQVTPLIFHTVSFNSNGGNSVPDQDVIKGGLADKPSPPAKSGHVFREWYAEDGLTNVWDFDGDTVNSDITLYARWAILRKLSFNTNGGSAVSEQEEAEGSHASEPTAPTQDGYAFNGWYSDVGLTNIWDFNTDTVNNDITLYAKWTILRTLSFNTNGGSAVSEQEVAEGDHAAEPLSPTRDGFAFMAWYSDVGLTNAWDFDTDTVNNEMTLYAKWTILRTVSFNADGGSAVPEQEVVEGGHASEPASPTQDGYAFMGWYSDISLTNAWDFDTDMVNNDITLYARWAILHTLSFNTNGGSAVSEQEVTEGGHAVKPIPSTRGGHVFLGWYSDSTLNNVWDFDGDTVNDDITLYAKWKTVPGSAGGIVFYDKGSYSDGWRYLELSTDDLSTGTVWGEYGTEVTGTGTGIGSGKSNTEKIVAALGTGDYAAKLCYDLNSGGHQDWFLPSMDELHELYNQSGTVGQILSGEYWTSTERDSNTAWVFTFPGGNRFNGSKNAGTKRVRAIRAF